MDMRSSFMSLCVLSDFYTISQRWRDLSGSVDMDGYRNVYEPIDELQIFSSSFEIFV